MDIIYSFEQYCPDKSRNITVEEKHMPDGRILLFCTETDCSEKCRCITKLAQLPDRKRRF